MYIVATDVITPACGRPPGAAEWNALDDLSLSVLP